MNGTLKKKIISTNAKKKYSAKNYREDKKKTDFSLKIYAVTHFNTKGESTFIKISMCIENLRRRRAKKASEGERKKGRRPEGDQRRLDTVRKG